MAFAGNKSKKCNRERTVVMVVFYRQGPLSLTRQAKFVVKGRYRAWAEFVPWLGGRQAAENKKMEYV